jgi:hypothetical protein
MRALAKEAECPVLDVETRAHPISQFLRARDGNRRLECDLADAGERISDEL